MYVLKYMIYYGILKKTLLDSLTFTVVVYIQIIDNERFNE